MSVAIPIKLLNEAQSYTVTVELTSGSTYRGKLVQVEDNMNIQLEDVVVTSREGQVSHLEHVYVRGSHVRMFVLPEMLQNAPMFRPDTAAKARAQYPPTKQSRPAKRAKY